MVDIEGRCKSHITPFHKYLPLTKHQSTTTPGKNLLKASS
jgi:hypothetical protein